MEYKAYVVATLNGGGQYLHACPGIKYHTDYRLTKDFFQRDVFKTCAEAREAAKEYQETHKKKIELNIVELKISETISKVRAV